MSKLDYYHIANVALYFEQYSDIFSLIQVNSKCLEGVHTLKKTPRFHNDPSCESFLKHFSPDTLQLITPDERSKEMMDKVKMIRTSFYSAYKYNLLTEEEIIKYIPKLTYIYFSVNDEDALKLSRLYIDNCQLFQNLQKIQGEINLIVEFLEKYTNNGKDKMFKFPKFVFMNSSGNYAIEF